MFVRDGEFGRVGKRDRAEKLHCIVFIPWLSMCWRNHEWGDGFARSGGREQLITGRLEGWMLK